MEWSEFNANINEILAAKPAAVSSRKSRQLVMRKYDAIATKKNGQFGVNGQRNVAINSVSFARAKTWATKMRSEGYRVNLIEVETKANEKVQRTLEFNAIPSVPYLGIPSANPGFNADYMNNKWSAVVKHNKAMDLYRKAVTRRNPITKDTQIRVYRGIKLLFSCSNESDLMEWIGNNSRRIAYPNVVIYFPDKVFFNREVVNN